MALIVQKYGGTSLATSARIRDVAARIGLERRAGHDVVVVVSAMGDSTDRLLSLAADICADPDPRELDMLLTTGERVSMALLAMALNSSGLRSISLTGSQSGIITDGVHTRARILDVKGDRIREGLADGRVVIVAGFQGVSSAREITTLGRGGSDLTAVALASRFAATRCEIYTDVDGVYTADPGRVPAARRIPAIDHETMVAYAELGAGVFHPRAARWAARERVPVVVRSSFIPGPGTAVGGAPAPAPAATGRSSPESWAAVGRSSPENRAAADPSAVDPPAVIGIGSEHRTQVLELSASPSQAAEALDEGGETPLRLIAAAGGRTFSAMDEAVASEVLVRAQAAGLRPVLLATGDLVSVIHQPGIEVGAVMDEMRAPAERLVPELLRGVRSTSFLIEPRHTDETVLALHRAFIESPLVPHPA